MATFSDNGTDTFDVPCGGEFVVAVEGDFGTGTFAVKFHSDGAWVTYSGGDTGSFTAAGERIFVNCGDTGTIQVALTGASSPDLNYHLSRVEYQL